MRRIHRPLTVAAQNRESLIGRSMRGVILLKQAPATLSGSDSDPRQGEMMKPSSRAALAAIVTASALLAADAGVTLIGVGAIPGDSLDLSALDGMTCRREDSTVCIPRATFGGYGSALTYTGHDNVFLAVPDRGPFDGRTTPGAPYIN